MSKAKSVMRHRSNRKLREAQVIAAGMLLAIVSVEPAHAQRQRMPPPEPSQDPWVSANEVAELQGAIAAYQQIASAGGWPKLPDRITLRLGDTDGNVASLRRRLEITGDVRPGGGDSYNFDESLEAGVKRYQMRNGLEPTGVVYGITQRSLNVPADTRLRQLELNLARMQELLPRLSAPKYIIMNAASFELQGLSDGRVEVTSRTIAGKRATPTPVVSASVQAINIYPYWNVPGTIAKAALIPAVRKDPSYLFKERIRVFSTFGGEEIDPSLVNWWGPEADRYIFRQDPGPQNALGVLRFDMPNKHIVYMHDTPMKNLFGYYERAYSSGCVRTQNFLDLAGWALAGQDGWTRQALEAVIASGERKTIKLAKPVPVHFIYLTAWVDNGAVQFRNDLYNRDVSAFDGGEDVAQRTMATSLAP
jgi:murein L,D-transpeptidase YcbB/YkuD